MPNYKIILLSIVLFFYLTNQSFAYFDPGTGTFILQSIIALISGAFFYASNPKLLLKKIKDKFKVIFSKKKKINK